MTTSMTVAFPEWEVIVRITLLAAALRAHPDLQPARASALAVCLASQGPPLPYRVPALRALVGFLAGRRLRAAAMPAEADRCTDCGCMRAAGSLWIWVSWGCCGGVRWWVCEWGPWWSFQAERGIKLFLPRPQYDGSAGARGRGPS